MKIGIPKALLYFKYYSFINVFFNFLGAEIVTAEDTNKKILDEGIKYAVDDACLPVKVFHGHVALIKDKCDYLFIPRFIKSSEGQYICPKFCGLPEMIRSSIKNLPPIIDEPILGLNQKDLWIFSKNVGRKITRNRIKIRKAFNEAVKIQRDFKGGIKDEGYKLNVALIGHPYNLYDNFINMDLIKKINDLNLGIITEEYMDEEESKKEIEQLFKKPFWSFANDYYGFASYVGRKRKVDGIIYISSFDCGIDSIIIELIKNKLKDFPLLVLKIDEQTGKAGLETRLEAFSDMLERRCTNENYYSASWK